MIFLATAVGSLALAIPQSPAASPAESCPILQRVVVLGASFSAGFGLQPNAASKTGLSEVVDAAILASHESVRATTSLLFFTNPDSIGEKLVAKTVAADPTLVVALDYLFWFGYGVQPSDGERLKHLEKGLLSLESIPGPLLLGDIPDMRAASEPAARGGVAPLLTAEQVPSAQALARLNARIRSWAAVRKEVVVVPVADLIARLRAGAEIEIRGNRWAGGAEGNLIGPDRLHPTLEGAVALWIAALNELVAARDDLPARHFDWDAKSIAQRVLDAKAKARAR
ncbi:MAG: hypothetical protein ACKVXR_16665 [Planctomycetota bacterium]